MTDTTSILEHHTLRGWNYGVKQPGEGGCRGSVGRGTREEEEGKVAKSHGQGDAAPHLP